VNIPTDWRQYEGFILLGEQILKNAVAQCSKHYALVLDIFNGTVKKGEVTEMLASGAQN
jgi:hypothetical protein